MNMDFYDYLGGKHTDGLILTTTPFLTLHNDNKYELLYYPIFNSTSADHYVDYVRQHMADIDYIFIFTGDIPCHPAPATVFQKECVLHAACETEGFLRSGVGSGPYLSLP